MIPNSTRSIQRYLFIFIILTAVSPARGDNFVAPSYWDAIFQLGYDPAAGQTGDVAACQRIETAYEFSRLVPAHVEADRELAATYHEMRARLSSLDAGSLMNSSGKRSIAIIKMLNRKERVDEQPDINGRKSKNKLCRL